MTEPKTLILKCLPNTFKFKELSSFVSKYVPGSKPYISGICDDNFPRYKNYSKMAYIDFSSSEAAARTFNAIKAEIEVSEKKGWPGGRAVFPVCRR